MILRLRPLLFLAGAYGLLTLGLARFSGSLYERFIPALLSASGRSQMVAIEGTHARFPRILGALKGPALPSWETLRTVADREKLAGFILLSGPDGRPVRWAGVPKPLEFMEGERAVFTPGGVLLAAGRSFPWGRALIGLDMPNFNTSRWIEGFDYYPPDILPPMPGPAPQRQYFLFKPSGPPLLGIGLKGLQETAFRHHLQGWLNFAFVLGALLFLAKFKIPPILSVPIGRLLLILVPWAALGLPTHWTDPAEFSIHSLGPLGDSPFTLLLTCTALAAMVLFQGRRPLGLWPWAGLFGGGAAAHLGALNLILGNSRLEALSPLLWISAACLSIALVGVGWTFRPLREPAARALPWLSLLLLLPIVLPSPWVVFPSLALGSLGILSWRPEPFFRVLLFALWGLLAVHLVWTGQARRFITAQYSEQKINQPILEIVELSRALPHILRNWDWEEQIPFFPILEDREALADFLSDGLNLNVLNIDYRLEISRPGRLVSSVQTRPFPPCRFPDREGVWTEGDETSHARFPLMAGGSPWGWVDLHFSPRSPVLSGKEPLPVQTGMYDLEGRRLESGSIFLPARLSPRSLGRLNGIVTQYQEGNRILLFYLPSWENPFPYLLFAGILLGGILLSLPFPLRPRSFLFLAVVPFLVLLSLTMLLALLLTARQNRDLVRLVNQWNSSVQQSLLASTERLSPTLTYTAGVLSGGERIRASARFCPDAVMARPPSLRPVVHPLEGENYLFFMDTEGRINALLQPTLPDLGRPLAWQSQRTWGLLLGLLSFSLMGLLLLARRFASPIQDMALAARRVQKGDLFNPEISLASEELRDLGEALKASITRLQSEDRTLKEILTALPAGIALFSGSTCLFRNAPMEGLQLPDDQAAGLPVAGTQSRDGRLLQFQKVPLPGERWLLIVRDITSEEAARKLQGFADIARIVAHEVKNPLTPIRLSLDYLRDLQTRDPQRFQKEAKAVLAEILGSVEDLEKAALEFSDFARLPALKKECVDLAELLEAWLNPFTASGRIVFLSSGSARVEVDTRLFKRALFNLINNGWQSASPPPRVHVQVRGGDHVEIHVRDEGPGLEPEARAHLFEPYFTTKTSGTGLGLLIARKIIEEHGGTLSLGPEGPGLHLIISLPKTGEGDSLSRPD